MPDTSFHSQILQSMIRAGLSAPLSQQMTALRNAATANRYIMAVTATVAPGLGLGAFGQSVNVQIPITIDAATQEMRGSTAGISLGGTLLGEQANISFTTTGLDFTSLSAIGGPMVDGIQTFPWSRPMSPSPFGRRTLISTKSFFRRWKEPPIISPTI
jgi:hypothetical protein